MRLNITITGSAPFVVDVEKEMTVGEFKDLLTKDEHFPKNLDYDAIKIIHFGKFLDDPKKTLEDYKVSDNGRIIIYVQKKTSTSTAPSAQSKTVTQSNEEKTNTEQTQSTQSSAAQPGNTESIQPPKEVTPQQSSTIVPPPPPSSSGSLGTSAPSSSSQTTAAPELPPVDPEKLNQMLIMGFEEGECKRALAASRGNVEMAIDFILSGNIPSTPVPAVPPMGGFGGISNPQAEIQGLLLYLQQNDPETYIQVRSNPALLGQILAQAGINLGGMIGAGASAGSGAGVPPTPPGTGALATPLNAMETDQVRQISDVTGLDFDRCKVVFVRLGRNPDAACDIIFESIDRFRSLSPADIDSMFMRMQQRPPPGNQGHGVGQGYDSDDGDSSMSNSEYDGDGDDDDFYL